MRSITATILLFIISFSLDNCLKSQTFHDYFIDSTDQALDLSNFLNTRVGFMPFPTFITEPAVGYGVGLGLIYFHRSKAEKELGDYKYLPPSMSMVGGVYTENGTWAALLGHQGSYKKDHIRYVGAIGYIHVNMDFYGSGINVEERAYRFNIKGFLLFQELAFRIKDLPIFVGANYSYFSNDVTFKLSETIPVLDDLSAKTKTAGLNGLILYDTRDNIFTPNKGIMTALELGFYSPLLGGNSSYGNANFRFYGFSDKILHKVVAGFRVSSHYKWGEVPFYELPFIQLRGIPVMRYQDNAADVFETEWRWNVWRRWSVLGFTGAGFVAENPVNIDLSEAKITYGTGLRYFIAKTYGLHIGLDFAWGPEKFVWYITFGSAWFR